jgi:cytoskeletal protein CcmA (bactofilin family)
MDAAIAKPELDAADDSGFALPSVLMLVMLLTLVSLSVLLLQHIRHLEALAGVARVKSDFAAQSAIALASTERAFSEHGRLLTFQDSSSALVRTIPWGILKLALAEGRSGRITSRRTALLGAQPPAPYKNAICYDSPSRQLILTGSTEITGSVFTGPMGAAVGSLPGERQPRHLPVAGTVTRMPGTLLPPVDRQMLSATFEPFVSFLTRGSAASTSPGSHSNPVGGVRGDSVWIPDSAESVDLSGNTVFARKLIRHDRPLTVRVQGSLAITGSAVVEGAIAFFVRGGVRIERGARIENVVVMSGDSIVVENGVTMRGQLIAPLIRVDENCTFTYPSVLCSSPLSGAKGQHMELAAGVRCEGMVILFSGTGTASPGQPGTGNLLVLHQGATVLGAIYSEGPVTLDGTVIGSVMASDFFFYQAPTSYLGWLRSAHIDRSGLPDGFAVPQALGAGKGEVVLWL